MTDRREQIPWTFEALKIGTGKASKELKLDMVYGTLKAGDYSIAEMEDKIALERKSPNDLYATLSRGRERFIRELSKLNDMEFAAVIVESEWSDLIKNPPLRSKMNPASINGMIVAWQIRYPRVHWWFLPGRYVASKQAFKLLDRFWQEKSE